MLLQLQHASIRTPPLLVGPALFIGVLSTEAGHAFDPTVQILRGYDSEASRHYLTGRDIEAAPPVLRGRVQGA